MDAALWQNCSFFDTPRLPRYTNPLTLFNSPCPAHTGAQEGIL